MLAYSPRQYFFLYPKKLKEISKIKLKQKYFLLHNNGTKLEKKNSKILLLYQKMIH